MKYKLALAFAICFALTSCVSVPIPPVGDKIGEYGKVQISVNVKYLPPENQIDWFNPIIPQPKLYKDK
jgi:starvation-inducible outer membrane lipoprotein